MLVHMGLACMHAIIMEICYSMCERAVHGARCAGLCCAALLARYGYSVTVCEAHYHAGGAAHAFEVQGYKFDSGPSFFAGLSGDLFTPILLVLELLSVHCQSCTLGMPMSPTHAVVGAHMKSLTAPSARVAATRQCVTAMLLPLPRRAARGLAQPLETGPGRAGGARGVRGLRPGAGILPGPSCQVSLHIHGTCAGVFHCLQTTNTRSLQRSG